MEITGNTVLITGGATGIGYALAEAFVNSGNTVIICGRREEKLQEAKSKLPLLNTVACDVSKEENRKLLFGWISEKFGSLNILVNNAGIQRSIDFKKGTEDLEANDDEIEINFRSQIYMAARFVPLLSMHKESAIINISSGLGFVPLATFPIYCATKAGIHSFTMSLRHQLKDTTIKVFEAIPPTVYDTELKGKPIPQSEWSISAVEMANAIMEGLKNNQYEIPAGPTKDWLSSSKDDLDKAFKSMNERRF